LSGFGFSTIKESHQCQRLFLAFTQMSKAPHSIEQAQILDRQIRAQREKRQGKSKKVAALGLAGNDRLGMSDFRKALA
jgi:hypothetical protein